MTDLYELGSSLFGRRRAEEENVLNDATTHTYVGTAVTDSEDGTVYVALSDDVTMPDEYDGEHGVGVEMPTSVAVAEGDEVMVTVFGGGTMKAPVVTGNPGWGDAVEGRVASAEGVASAAQAVAEATGQHFWPDTDGVHVTEVTQEDWNDSTSSGYHSGANVLINALGQLFRDGLNNLLALLPGTATTYTETIQGLKDVTEYTLERIPSSIVSVKDGSYTLSNREYYVSGNTLHLERYTNYVITVTYRVDESNVALFDGLGNDAQNIVATYGGNRSIIGSELSGHMVIDEDSIDIYDGDTRWATIGEASTFGCITGPNTTILNTGLWINAYDKDGLNVGGGIDFSDTGISSDTSLHFSTPTTSRNYRTIGLRSMGGCIDLDAPRLGLNDYNGHGGVFDMSHVIDMLSPTRVEATGNTVSVPHNAYTILQSVTLDPGIYLVVIGCYAANNSTGYRGWTWSSASSISAQSFGHTLGMGAANVAIYNTLTQLQDVTTRTTYHVFGWQNSGGALNMRSTVAYVKIG